MTRYVCNGCGQTQVRADDKLDLGACPRCNDRQWCPVDRVLRNPWRDDDSGNGLFDDLLEDATTSDGMAPTQIGPRDVWKGRKATGTVDHCFVGPGKATSLCGYVSLEHNGEPVIDVESARPSDGDCIHCWFELLRADTSPRGTERTLDTFVGAD